MENNKVIELYSPEEYHATCPECGSTAWFLRINGLGDSWDKLTGSECMDCGFLIDWIEVSRNESKGEADAEEI